MGLSSRAEKPWQPESSTDLLHKVNRKVGLMNATGQEVGLL